MNKHKLSALLLILLLTVQVTAQETERVSDPEPGELQFIGYSFTRWTGSNVSPTNDILQGQVIGRLFGQNSTNTIPQTAVYLEQRFVPMFIYKPKILDGFATFRGLFKIDYTWGDQAYGVGNNRGGAINGGQINLQTLMANVDIHPDSADWNLVIGMQRLFDNARDPNVNTLGYFQNSSYKLSYWGTQAVGVSLFANLSPVTKGRIGYFQLWENEIRRDDDVALWMLDVESRVTPRIEVGADFWYAYDRGKGFGGISVLGQGLNSALAEYNGATRIFLPVANNKYEADIFWTGVRTAYNRDFMAGRWQADAYIMTNYGTLDTISSVNSNDFGSYGTIFGVAANAAVQYKYGMTANDKLSAEIIYSSGDDNGIADGTLNSVITGNVYGSPVGIYSAHRAFLLFPDPQVINRYYSAVHDISNLGYGVTAGFFNYSKDLIPNKMSLKAGYAFAISNVTPAGGTSFIGQELNAEFKYNIKVFLTLGISAAYLNLGDFYNAPTATYDRVRPKDPWVLFTTLSWLMF